MELAEIAMNPARQRIFQYFLLELLEMQLELIFIYSRNSRTQYC
jgi:hypothetical protein